MINFVFFDLDDTLLDFLRAEHAAFTKTLTQLNVHCTDALAARYSEINISQWKLLEKGQITAPELKIKRFRLLFDENGITASPEKTAKLYESNLSHGHYFVEGATELLAKLRGKYRLFLVSNGTASVQYGRLESAGISEYFEGIFISEEIGFKKPDREFFHSCFARIPGFSADEAVIIGDSLSSDIAGGINAGIKTLWFNLRGLPASDTVIPDKYANTLSEIPAILAAM